MTTTYKDHCDYDHDHVLRPRPRPRPYCATSTAKQCSQRHGSLSYVHIVHVVHIVHLVHLVHHVQNFMHSPVFIIHSSMFMSMSITLMFNDFDQSNTMTTFSIDWLQPLTNYDFWLTTTLVWLPVLLWQPDYLTTTMTTTLTTMTMFSVDWVQPLNDPLLTMTYYWTQPWQRMQLWLPCCYD